MNTFNSSTGRGMFHHWTALYYSLSNLFICKTTTRSEPIQKTISRMHSHLHFNKIHNTLTSCYNTSIFLFGQSCLCELQKYWIMCKLSIWHVTVYEFCLQHVIKSIFKSRNLFQVTPSVNSINLPSKLNSFILEVYYDLIFCRRPLLTTLYSCTKFLVIF